MSEDLFNDCRVLDMVDVLICGRCLGPMTVLAALSDPPAVAKILTHLGLPSTSPAMAPARRRGQLDLFDELGDSGADESIDSWGDPPPRSEARTQSRSSH